MIICIVIMCKHVYRMSKSQPSYASSGSKSVWTLESRNQDFCGVGGGGRVRPRPGGALPSNRVMEMCRWMGSHFHDWIDYNGVAFSTELLEWDCIFSGFGGNNIQARREFVY